MRASPVPASGRTQDSGAAGSGAGLLDMARLRSYKARRSSSWDRTRRQCRRGSAWSPGTAATLLDVQGAGVVTHIWFTIDSDDPHHLKNLVLRAWWDGEASPSIEAPIGDFYGLGLGEYFLYQSALTAVAPQKALNAYFKMPFATAAKITLTNEGPQRTDSPLLRGGLRLAGLAAR